MSSGKQPQHSQNESTEESKHKRQDAREALEGSIRKWKSIVTGTGVDLGMRNCPLCQVFYVHNSGCGVCPMRDRSGRPCCEGTPYYDAWIGNKSPENAQAELDFLISLRPAETET